MRADHDIGPLEGALLFVTSPVWLPIYGLVQGSRRLGQALQKRKQARAKPTEAEKPDLWASLTTEDQRAVIAALIKLGRPAKNVELAREMRCSPGESSKRRKALNGALKQERIGRDVWISLPPH